MCHGLTAMRGDFFLSEGHCKGRREKVLIETQTVTGYVRAESEGCFIYLRNGSVQVSMYVIETDVKSPDPPQHFLLYLNVLLGHPYVWKYFHTVTTSCQP